MRTAILLAMPNILYVIRIVYANIKLNRAHGHFYVHFVSARSLILLGITLLATVGIYIIAKKTKRDRIRKGFIIGCYLTATLPIIAPILYGIVWNLVEARGSTTDASILAIIAVQLLIITVPPVVFAHIAHALYMRAQRQINKS